MSHTSSYHIDINADLGEGTGNDASIMPLISSCNIACGGHYGDEESMRTTIQLALKHRVKIGAHPSFPDRDHFGRRVMTLTKQELQQTVFDQLLHFMTICELEDAPLHHVKPHGALYNYAAKDAATADAIVEAIISTKNRPRLYAPYGSVLHRKAENLLPVVFEAFIDRRYNNDGSLVSRAEARAVIHEKDVAWNQLHQLIVDGSVTSLQGEKRQLPAQTFCIHGDHPNSVAILEYIHQQCRTHHIILDHAT